jgi:hypothetical protein
VNREEFLQAQQEAERQIAARQDAIYRQLWRIWRNHRLRAEIQVIRAEAARRWWEDWEQRRPAE